MVVAAVEHDDDDVESGDGEANDVIPHDNAMASGGGVSGGHSAEGVVFDGDVSDFSAMKDFVRRLHCDKGEEMLHPIAVIHAVQWLSCFRGIARLHSKTHTLSK